MKASFCFRCYAFVALFAGNLGYTLAPDSSELRPNIGLAACLLSAVIFFSTAAIIDAINRKP